MKYNLVKEYHKIYKESVIVAVELGQVQIKVQNLVTDIGKIRNKIMELENNIYGEKIDEVENALLCSPCVFCDYNGQGYWQVGTHDKKCPWHKWGGGTERNDMLPDVIRKLYNESDKRIGESYGKAYNEGYGQGYSFGIESNKFLLKNAIKYILEVYDKYKDRPLTPYGDSPSDAIDCKIKLRELWQAIEKTRAWYIKFTENEEKK